MTSEIADGQNGEMTTSLLPSDAARMRALRAEREIGVILTIIEHLDVSTLCSNRLYRALATISECLADRRCDLGMAAMIERKRGYGCSIG